MIPLFASLYAALLQFAVGSLFAALISDSGGKVTPGFLRQAAVAALCGALLAWMLTGRGAPGESESALALLLLTAVYTVLQFTSKRAARLWSGWLGLLAGAVAIVLAAGARPSPSLGPLLTGLASAASAVALGTSVMALVLGHWYLVTPRLSAVPLRLLCDLAILSLIALTGFALWYVVERPGRDGVRAGRGGVSLVRLRGGDPLPDRRDDRGAALLPGVAARPGDPGGHRAALHHGGDGAGRRTRCAGNMMRPADARAMLTIGAIAPLGARGGHASAGLRRPAATSV